MRGMARMRQVLEGMAGVGVAWLFLLLRDLHREGGIALGSERRARRHALSEKVSIRIQHEDAALRGLPAKHVSLTGSVQVLIQLNDLHTSGQQPAYFGFGEPERFWSRFIRDIRADVLPQVAIEGDVYLLAQIPFPKDGRALVRINQGDFKLLKQVRRVDGKQVDAESFWRMTGAGTQIVNRRHQFLQSWLDRRLMKVRWRRGSPHAADDRASNVQRAACPDVRQDQHEPNRPEPTRAGGHSQS